MATEFYAEQLSTSEAATGRHFLTERGFDRSAAERFSVGFAPRTWDAPVVHICAGAASPMTSCARPDWPVTVGRA